MAPAGTPQPVLDKLATAARRAVERADVQARFDKDGVEPVGGTPAAFKALVTREIAQWRDLAKQANIKIE
jgi:tripartite-type tricarboxylate transporter receptor subunit TctC